MPCDARAVVSLRLEANAGQEIVGKDVVVQTLMAWLKAEFGCEVRSYSSASLVFLKLLTASGRITVELDALGQLTVSGPRLDRQNLALVRDRIAVGLAELANEVLKLRLESTLRQNYDVSQVVVTPEGAKMFTLEV